MINLNQIRDNNALSWVALVALLWFVLISLGGCTSGGGTKPDLVTDSDETEARKRARIRLELAMGYYNNGQTTVALDELKQSIATDPSIFEAHNLRGLIYMRLNDLALAEESFRRALLINPKAASVQHNYGWLLCQQRRIPEAVKLFGAAIENPLYTERSKTWMAQGVCQLKVGELEAAEFSLLQGYELDAGNPTIGYNLALVFFQRRELVRSQFYVRRINNSEQANSESLWLGVKVERGLFNPEAVVQLGTQLKKRFPNSKEAAAYERGAFNE